MNSVAARVGADGGRGLGGGPEGVGLAGGGQGAVGRLGARSEGEGRGLGHGGLLWPAKRGGGGLARANAP